MNLFQISPQDIRTKRQQETNKLLEKALFDGLDWEKILPYINEKEFKRTCKEFRKSTDEMLSRLAGDRDLSRMAAGRMAKNSSRQSSKDELYIINGIDNALDSTQYSLRKPDVEIRFTHDGRILTRKEFLAEGLKKDLDGLKSVDAILYNHDKLLGYTFAKLLYGTGGHQDNVVRELNEFLEWAHQYGDSDKLYIGLIDTDQDISAYKAKQTENIWVVDHTELQQRIFARCDKQVRGQFYTTTDPFQHSAAFQEWWELVPQGVPILEPFAGAGHLFQYIDGEWAAFDIDPQHPDVKKRDTMASFPQGFQVCITNPPYLAKNAIKRKKIGAEVKYEDLYLDCIEKCLENSEYVAAIIPSTFWGTSKFRDRLFAWDKIDHQIFSDTLSPAGVGYWVPDSVEKTKLFVNGKPLAFDADLWTPTRVNLEITFNDAEGNLVLDAIDTTKHHNIKVKSTEGFDRDKFLKGTSRNYSLIKCSELTSNDYDSINHLIEKWREHTSDFYLTSFKSTMQEGKYRKRIGFNQFKWLVHKHLRKENRI